MRLILDNLKMGKKLYEEKKYSDALAFFYKALAVAELSEDLENQIESREYIARSYYRLNRCKEGIKQLEMLNNYPLSIEKQIEVLTLTGACLYFLCRFDESINTLQQLSNYDLEIAHRKMHINLGVVLFRLYKYRQKPTLEQALEHFNNALQYSLGNIVANKLYRNIGISLIELGKYSEALQMFDKSLEYSDDAKEMHYTKIEIARTYSRLGRFTEAEFLLADAFIYLESIEDLYGMGHTLLARGFNHIKKKEYAKAEEYIFDAILNFLKIECFLEVGDCYNLLAKEYRDIDPVKSEIYLREFDVCCSKVEEDSETNFAEIQPSLHK